MMQTKEIIQAQANVIRIINMKKGDVFKSVDTTYTTPEIRYGIILDMMNDGSNTFIEVLSYKKSYGSITAEIKLYKGTDDLTIFPSSIEDISSYMSGAIKYLENSITSDKKELQEKIDSLAKAKEFVSGELSKKLGMVEFKEMPQLEYDSSVPPVEA